MSIVEGYHDVRGGLSCDTRKREMRHEKDVDYNSCDKMSKQAENCIREAIKNIKEKKRKKCNLAAIKKYLEDESSLPIDLELQLNEMVRRGLINKEETYSLGSACKGATAAVVLEYSDENVIGECNVKHDNPELTNLSERIKFWNQNLIARPNSRNSISAHNHHPTLSIQ